MAQIGPVKFWATSAQTNPNPRRIVQYTGVGVDGAVTEDLGQNARTETLNAIVEEDIYIALNDLKNEAKVVIIVHPLFGAFEGRIIDAVPTAGPADMVDIVVTVVEHGKPIDVFVLPPKTTASAKQSATAAFDNLGLDDLDGLADLKLSFGTVKAHDMYPNPLPDLFRGSQVVAFGRYSASGQVAVELTAVAKGQKKQFAYDAHFPEVSTGTEFIASLWAQRKIAYLLDQVRLHGENKELREEVMRLSKEYGIATPYTSYLVLEDEAAYIRHGIVRGGAWRAARAALPEATARTAPLKSGAARRLGEEEGRRRAVTLRLFADSRTLNQEAGGRAGDAVVRYNSTLEGKDAVTLGRLMREWKEADSGEAGLGGVPAGLKKVGEKTFLKIGQVFVDTELTEDMPTLKVQWASDAYFALLDAMPELMDYLMLGENVIVVINGKALVVGGEGKEQLTEEEIREFFEG